MAYLFKDLQHTAAQIDQSIDDLASHIANGVIHITAAERQAWNAKATTGDVNAEAEARAQADGELQTAINAKASSADLTAEETARANADAAQMNGIIGLINEGSKNVLDISSAQTLVIGDLTFTVNSDFSITLSGKNSGSSAAFFSIPVTIPAGLYYFTGMSESGGSGSYRLELRTPTATGTVSLTCENTAPVSWGPSSTYNGFFNIRVAAGYEFTTAKTVKPMICERWKYNITDLYVPYRPSLNDLWAMIKALQT